MVKHVVELPPCLPVIKPHDVLQKLKKKKKSVEGNGQQRWKWSKEMKSDNAGSGIRIEHKWNYKRNS